MKKKKLQQWVGHFEKEADEMEMMKNKKYRTIHNDH